MKTRHPLHLIGPKGAEPHEKPHLRLPKESSVVAAPFNERRSQQEDELRSLIKSLQRRERGVKEGAVYRGYGTCS